MRQRFSPGLACVLVILCSGAAAPAADDRPNIVYILADDLGYADVGWHGPDIKTPNLDKLAMGGARLEQFYAQPVCSPTRAALMTGRYPMRHGLQVGVVRPWAQYGLPLEERTLPQALKSAGYETAIVGKWHLGHFKPEYLPTRRGFDHQYGHYNGALDYNTHIRDGGFDWHRDDKVCRDEGYSTHLVARECVRLVRERDKARPLFLYVPFNAVHGPYQVPEKYKEPYANLAGQRRTYAGMIAAMDEAIGQIVGAIDEAGIRKNTLIWFSSDNGGPAPGKTTSNGVLRAGKGTLYEGGVRVAACANWEGKIAAGTIVNEPIHIADCYPTFLKLAGASMEQKTPLDGLDVWPTIAAGRPSPHAEILINATPVGGAIRAGNWKLVLNGNQADDWDAADAGAEAGAAQLAAARQGKGAGKKAGGAETVELYDLSKDLSEKSNLAQDNPEKVKELKARFDALAKQAVSPKSKAKAPGFKSPGVWGEP